MPAKRRAEKRRLDPMAEVQAWENVFDSGHDFFGDLREIGVTRHHERYCSREVGRAQQAELVELAKDAWHRLGHLFLETRAPNPREPWALTEFGEPPHAD